MNYAEDPEREWLLSRALCARKSPDIAAATREMDQWVNDHPDDLGILDVYEVLANMREIAEYQQGERNCEARTEVAA